MSGQPWLKFYPADWRSEPTLRAISIGARGMWMEMLCLMWQAEPQGSLLLKGQQISSKMLASLCGVTLRDCEALIAELESVDVFSRDEDGTIFSRRMRKDVAKLAKDKANGSSGGNPKLKKGVNPPANPISDVEVKGDDKAQRARTSATQKPEARIRNTDSSAAAESGTPRPEPQPPPPAETVDEADGLEAECRLLVGTEPCLTSLDFHVLHRLIEEGTGITAADVVAGIRVALAKADPTYRFRSWRNFENWIRNAAKDRLGLGPRPGAPSAQRGLGTTMDVARGLMAELLALEATGGPH